MRWEPATAARQIGQRMPAPTTLPAHPAQKAAWKHGRSAAATGASRHMEHAVAPHSAAAGPGAAAGAAPTAAASAPMRSARLSKAPAAAEVSSVSAARSAVICCSRADRR